jgi:hypothetical protein
VLDEGAWFGEQRGVGFGINQVAERSAIGGGEGGGRALAEGGEEAGHVPVAAEVSRVGLALPRDTVYFGEISLSGRLRQVVQAPARLKEAEKLGFTGAVLPDASTTGLTPTISLQRISILSELIELVAPSGEPTMSDPTVSRPGAGGARIDRR